MFEYIIFQTHIIETKSRVVFSVRDQPYNDEARDFCIITAFRGRHQLDSFKIFLS